MAVNKEGGIYSQMLLASTSGFMKLVDTKCWRYQQFAAQITLQP